LIYLTQTRLMQESERTVLSRALSGDEIPRRVCSQLLADPSRYALWHSRHERRMSAVSEARLRERQILSLRSVSAQQVHRAALVRYLRDHRVTGARREQTLREFYGPTDAREAATAEHRSYLLAESTQLCAAEILDLVGDYQGIDLVRSYELAYGQFFSMFCDQARDRQNGRPYLLAPLLPEVRAVAERLRLELLDAQLMPRRRAFVKTAPSAAPTGARLRATGG
jgi:hypothetical protein